MTIKDIDKLKALLDEFDIGYEHIPRRVFEDTPETIMVHNQTIASCSGDKNNKGDDMASFEFQFDIDGNFVEAGAFAD